MEFFIFLIILILTIAVFVFYLQTFIVTFSSKNHIKTFAVVELIQALKKACPVEFGGKWKLLSLNVGLPRCWTKDIQLPVSQSNMKLYGTVGAISCSSANAFSLIADVTRWGEWEPLPSTLALTLDKRGDLSQDNFMQADRIVSVHTGTNVQSYIAFYRFMNLQDSTMRWILFWNAEKLEFMFFLIQPAVSKTMDSQCLLTHIFCCRGLHPTHLPNRVAQRLKNIQEFLTLSQLHVKSFSTSTSSEVFPPVAKPVQTSAPRGQLHLEPFSTRWGLRCRFKLVLKKVDEKPKNKVSTLPIDDPCPKHRRPLRRSKSEAIITPVNSFKSIAEHRSKSFEQKLKSSVIAEEPISLQDLSPKNESIVSEIPVDKESVISQESTVDAGDDVFRSSTSDFEHIDMDANQQFLDCKLADFLTQGNYGASELQAEMLLASQFDQYLSPEEQSSGGWMYHSTYKGITVLTKTTAGQFIKILSFLCQVDVPVSSNDVWKCIKNPRFRFILDETVKTVKIIERISDSQKLIHVYSENSGFLRRECVDLCLLQTEREELNNSYSSFHSIEYEKCPLMTQVTRGSLRPSGWVVEKQDPNKCRVTYLFQAIVNNPDSLYFQDLCSSVPQCVYNLKNYFLSKPK